MKKGDVIIFPTDTVYGMGAKLYDLKGLQKIYELKGRDKSKPIPILVANIVSINPIAKYNYETLNVMTKFWPGPLTIILETTPEFFKKTGEKTIAIRIPNHYLALDLINHFGPLRTTSVNLSGQPPLNDLSAIKALFEGKVTEIYGEHTGEYLDVASTIIDVTSGQVKVVREGAISLSEILKEYHKK